MRLKALILIYLLIGLISPCNSHAIFIANRESLKNYCGNSDYVIIASTGRSGSTMLTGQLKKSTSSINVLKTHLLPPNKKYFSGKILFIFSNPDKSAESALYMMLHHNLFGERHFTHVETANREWLHNIGGSHGQNEQNNLLSYDALGTYEHLKVWLYTGTKPAKPSQAQILAIKYENLWEENTITAIRNFLGLPHFNLPPKRPRGHKNLSSKELKFRELYNLGTKNHPRYAAYDDARRLWEQAPPFQYLRISFVGREVPQ